MSSGRLQAYITEFFVRMARKINTNPQLLQGFQQEAGRSILVMMSDIDEGKGPPASGLLLDSAGMITVVDPGTVSPTLTVDTTFRTFMDIMDGKQSIDTAFYYNMVNIYGARFLADYLVIKDFFERLRRAA